MNKLQMESTIINILDKYNIKESYLIGSELLNALCEDPNASLSEKVLKMYISIINSNPHFTVVDKFVKEIVNDSKRFTEKTSLKLLDETFREYHSLPKEKQTPNYLLGVFKGKKQETWVAHQRQKSYKRQNLVNE